MNFFKFWLPAIGWAGVIFVLSSMPDLNSGMQQDFALRKLAHVAEFFILTGLIYRAVVIELKTGRKRIKLYPFVLSFLYAMTDETHQLFVVGREGCVRDVLIDLIGIVGFFIFLKFKKNA